MNDPAKVAILRSLLEDYRSGNCTTGTAIEQIANILVKPDVPVKPVVPDIQRGTVFTTRYGSKCVAMSKPDKDGQFWMYNSSGHKQFQVVKNVIKVHKKESERMIRVLSDMCDSPAAWYNQPIEDDQE